MEIYDWIILGGGAAGLSLADRMSRSTLTGKILLIEQAQKTAHDRTWCYWSQADLPGTPDSDHVWQQGIIRSPSGAAHFAMSPFTYRCVFSDSYYETLYGRLAAHPQITIRYESAVSITGTQAGVRVETDQGIYAGKWAFNSLLQHAPAPPGLRAGLKQHFVGYWIDCAKDTFDPDAFTLMDFRVQQQGGVQFVYILPMTTRHALVEYTVFSDAIWPEEAYQTRLRSYLRSHHGLEAFSIVHRESGVIPMSTDVFPRTSENRIVHIGTAGGLTKASTGYTFDRIQADSDRLVRNLEAWGRPFPALQATGRFAFYDRLLIWLIRYHPEKIPDIMLHLFSRNPARRTFRFLAEKTRLWEEAKLFFSLPWRPFLQALWHVYFQPNSPKSLGSVAQPVDVHLPADQLEV